MTEVLHHPPKPDLLSDEWEDKNTHTATPCDSALGADLEESSAFDYPSMPPVDMRQMLTRRERRRQRQHERDFRPHKMRRRLGAAALCISSFVGTAYGAFMYDQTTLANMVWGDQKATIETLWDHQANYFDPETYIYVIPGTGIRSATPTIAKPLEPSFETLPNSKLMSLQEGSHPQIEDTFAAIDGTIDKDNPPDRVILYGMSAGGKEALSLAVHLRQTLPKADLSIILSSTPYDQNSAYELQGSHNTLPLIADLSAQLNMHGGPVTRMVVEMYNRRNQCQTNGNFDLTKCVDIARKVANEKLSSKATSNELFEWQVEWTRINSASSDIAALKNVDNGPDTSILYINTTKDTIVDESEAMPKFEADATKNNIPFTVIKLDGPHASESQFPKNYNNLVLKKYFAAIDGIHARIDEQETRAEEAAIPPQVAPTDSSNEEPTTNAAGK